METEESHGDYLFTVRSVNGQKGTCSLVIGGVKVKDILIDCGAGRNVMSQETWEYLKKQRVKCVSRKDMPVLYAYGNNQL